jgi:hypothetical protein
VALLGIVAGIAVPQVRRGSFDLWQAHQQLIGDLRQTRTDALTRGDHFVLEISDAGAYAVRRMAMVGADWVKADGEPVRSRTLPPGVVFTEGVGAEFEFDTRGLLVVAEAARVLELQDERTQHARRLTVWPSGQVMPQ